MNGRPFEPGNKFGRGRPPGSRNKRSLAAQELLDKHAESILRKAMVSALQGDVPMQRALLGYILPRRRDLPVKIGTLLLGTIEELDHTSEVVLKKAFQAQITLGEAAEIGALLENRRLILETRDFEKRLRAVEQRTEKT
jgi:hypothetical protein